MVEAAQLAAEPRAGQDLCIPVTPPAFQGIFVGIFLSALLWGMMALAVL